jgi:hypothetical protein
VESSDSEPEHHQEKARQERPTERNPTRAPICRNRQRKGEEANSEVAAQLARKDRRELLLATAGKWEEWTELRGRIVALQELLEWQEEGGTRKPGWGKIDKLWRGIRDGTELCAPNRLVHGGNRRSRTGTIQGREEKAGGGKREVKVKA